MGTIFRLFKNYISVNPTLVESSFKVNEFRVPPGSVPDIYQAPEGPADKLSKNYYYTRDVRRNYPKTVVYSQSDLALLLSAPAAEHIEAPKDTSVQAPQINVPALTQALGSLESASSNSYSQFLPPIPGSRYKYHMSEETYIQVPGSYWPIYLVK